MLLTYRYRVVFSVFGFRPACMYDCGFLRGSKFVPTSWSATFPSPDPILDPLPRNGRRFYNSGKPTGLLTD